MAISELSKQDAHTILDHRLFLGLTESEICEVVSLLDPRPQSFTRHEQLAAQGERISDFGILLSGSVFSRYVPGSNPRFKPRILSYFEPPALIGTDTERDQICAFTLIASSAGSVLWLSADKLTDLGGDRNERTERLHNIVILNFLAISGAMKFQIENALWMLSHNSLRQKILAFMFIMRSAGTDENERSEKNRRFTCDLNRAELANYLCVDRSTLSTELTKLRSEGVIDFETRRNWFEVQRDLTPYLAPKKTNRNTPKITKKSRV
jgi:CRP-like cAMP-binding protein